MTQFNYHAAREFCKRHYPHRIDGPLPPEEQVRTFTMTPQQSLEAAIVADVEPIVVPPPLHPTNDQGASVQ